MNWMEMRPRSRRGRRWASLIGWFVVILTLVGLPAAPAWAQRVPDVQGQQSIQPYLDRVADQVSEFTLDNGMKFIVLERHQAPVVSFMIHADVGAVNEADGKTGVAHYLEHLAFKGTEEIGTKNYAAEQALFEEMDQVFQQILKAEADGNSAQAEELKAQLAALQTEAASYVEQNKYGQIIDQAGGVGLNATTGADATRYFYSLPSNKLELWMSLESERFLEPVFREFFEEKNVILEERRMRVDNSPIGKMVEEFLGAAFEEHPYRRPIIGYEEDLYRATRDDIRKFYDTYYGPQNLIVAVVGDVDPAQVREYAQTYFGRYQPQSDPPEVTVEEPVQTASREFTLEL
ncbi:peptidase M16, partial [filamentous cyanobacterium CCP5]